MITKFLIILAILWIPIGMFNVILTGIYDRLAKNPDYYRDNNRIGWVLIGLIGLPFILLKIGDRLAEYVIDNYLNDNRYLEKLYKIGLGKK